MLFKVPADFRFHLHQAVLQEWLVVGFAVVMVCARIFFGALHLLSKLLARTASFFTQFAEL